MDVVELQDKIVARPEYIEELFDSMGFENIRDRGEYYSFKNIDGDNPSAIAIYKDNLHYENFSHGSKGTLFTLVMETRQCNFPESIRFVANRLNIKISDVKVELPFGGFYKKLIASQSDEPMELEEYDDARLPTSEALSYKFFCDGVSYQVQEKLGVRYSHDDDAVLIPIYDFNHRLVGCKGRSNKPNVDLAHRWFMYIPYKKSNIVYGMDVNYEKIVKHDMAIVFEAEKSVMQGMSFDMNCGLAIGGHCFSNAQVRYIKMLGVKEIVVAFDQDLDEEEVKYESKKLITQNRNKVSYIYDRQGIYLPKGSKMSPSDKGKDCFIDLMRNCKYEVEADDG